MTISGGTGSYLGRADLLLRAALAGAAIAMVTALLIGGQDLPALKALALWTSGSTGLLLNIMGVQATTQGTVVGTEAFAVDIVSECLALGPVFLFAVAVLVHSRSFRSKLNGLVFGIVIIVAVNLVRIVSLFLVGLSYPQLMEPIHLLVWQPAMVLVAVVLWMLWSQGRLTADGIGKMDQAFLAMAILLIASLIWLGIAREYNGIVAGLASPLAVDGVSIRALGSGFLIDAAPGGGPVAVSGFTMQWGVLLLTSIIGATSAMSIRRRLAWLFALAVAAFVLHGTTLAVLASSLNIGMPFLSRFALGAFVAFWGVGPIVLAGVWCLVFWKNGGRAIIWRRKRNKDFRRATI